ncbi:DUF4232 domain-containing protein [Microbacterium sp. NE2HP2]|uniref:DUF4232 domain-containing protein n=1 Tax=Microbacterium plantarum TaxID=1816425 RepID=UPI002366132E|nr:DUF4232 domain-containing protein [Microbacterium plantarum]MDD7945875.1 DUF4232 domain-containing protein [Microbacterium plantarum]
MTRRLVAAGGLAAALWAAVALTRWGFSRIPSGAAQLANLVPPVVPAGLMWGDSGPWLVLSVAIGAVAVGLVFLWVTTRMHTRSSLLLAAWFAAVAAGALVGLALDLGAAWSSLAMFGPRGLVVGEFGAASASGALWGLAVGWLPGLVARTRDTRMPDARMPADVATPRSRPLLWIGSAAAVATIAAAGLSAGSDAARTAAVNDDVAAQQEAEAAVTFGAMPDPAAPGVPVPETSGTSAPTDPRWCTEDRAMVLKGEPDAATGHRGMPIRLMNFSEESCVIEGYPDVAFGDQNEHLLTVELTPGSSFMAQDPGPERIEVPAGGYAVAFLGWDGASTHGALVTKRVYAAASPGMTRGSWPIDLDIVEGSTVAVTAWELDTTPTGRE